MFASIHVPDFSVEAIVRHQSELRHKRVIVIDGKPPLLTVIAMNALARDGGVEPGMTKFQAEQFPYAAVRQRSPRQEASAQAALLDCAGAFSPRVEDTRPGTVVLDVEGLERLFGSRKELANNLSRQVSGAGLVAHVAIASNPDAAICAAHGPSSVAIVERGAEAEYLKDFPIGILPLDGETHETLQCWGIRRFGELAKLPAKGLSVRLGQAGIHLHRLACGRASRPLKPRPESLRFEESMDLDYSLGTLEPLTFILNRLCDALFHRLRSRGLATHELDLTLQRENGPLETAPTVTLRLPIPAQNPRVVTKLLMLELEARPPGAAICGVRIEAKPTKPRIVQNGLFTPLSPEPEKLELTLARIAGVVGSENVGSPELEDSHARERFRMKHFGELGRRTRDLQAKRGDFEATVLRAFRPPLEATVQLRDGIPTWIGFSGVHGPIETASGPWFGSGDWWNAERWNSEEWDVAVSSLTAGAGRVRVRIYRDVLTGRWYAGGMYD
jgi:protein ImuB